MKKAGDLHTSSQKNSCTGVLELLYLVSDKSRIGKTYDFSIYCAVGWWFKYTNTAKENASKTRTTIKGEK